MLLDGPALDRLLEVVDDAESSCGSRRDDCRLWHRWRAARPRPAGTGSWRRGCRGMPGIEFNWLIGNDFPWRVNASRCGLTLALTAGMVFR